MYKLSKNHDSILVDQENLTIPVVVGNRHFEEVFTKLLEKGLVSIVDGQVTFFPDGELLVSYDDTEDLVSEIKSKRAAILAEVDVKINIAEDNDLATKDLRTYRQALRDITKQKGYPKKVTWPKEPK